MTMTRQWKKIWPVRDRTIKEPDNSDKDVNADDEEEDDKVNMPSPPVLKGVKTLQYGDG